MPSLLPPHAHLLFGPDQIQERVKALAGEIDSVYKNLDLVVVGVLKGAVHFVSDLLRGMTLDPCVEWVRVSTYREGTTAVSGSLIHFVGDLELVGKDVLVADDILDSGRTYQTLNPALLERNPARVRWAFLLEKEGACERAGFQPDFVGFHVPEAWVVGYGLDLAEKYRNLAGIYALEQTEDR